MKKILLLLILLSYNDLRSYCQNPNISQLLNKPIQLTIVDSDTFLTRDLTEYLDLVLGMPNHLDNDHSGNKILRSYFLRPHANVKTLEKYFKLASEEFKVPVEILRVIGQIENNWSQTGPTIDQGWGIMHLVENSYCNTLNEAAKLLGLSPQVLKDNAYHNIRGAASLISSYAGKSQYEFESIEDWFPAIAKFSGLISSDLREMQAINYFEVLNNGVTSNTVWGEEIVIKPYTINFDKIKAFKTSENKTERVQSPDYGPAIFNAASTCNYTTGRTSSVDTWVNHWIGSGTYLGTISWFQTCPCPTTTPCGSCPSNTRGCNASNVHYGASSAHFVIKNSNGEITQMVAVANTAYHCGASGFPANNPRSIGVEHEATAANPNMWNSASMLSASATMACYFKNQFGFPITQNSSPGICGHNDMPGTSTTCPGSLPWTTWFANFNSSPGCGAVTTPVNDNCSAATSLTSSTSCNYLGNQTVNNATASGKPKGTCDNYSGTPALADVWYSFQAQSSSHTVTVDPNGSSLDAVIVAYSSCSSNTEIGCSDTPGGNGAISTLNLTGLTVGNTYYIRIYDYGLQTTNGGFRICITHTASNCPDNFETNDNCSSATNVFASPLGTGTSDYTLNATIGYAGDQDWYKVNLAACGTFTVTLSGLPLNYDMELYATGATCTSNILHGSYNSGTNNEQIVYIKPNSAAATVYVKVYPITPSTFTASTCYSLRFQWASSMVTPAVNISANPSGTICTGQSVTFTATPTNGGTSPSYQWKVNGSNVGTNSPTYTTSSLTNGQVVTCVMTSSSSCASTSSATSNGITMSVSGPVTPAVSIAITSGSNPTCSGQSLTFTATPTNGGSSPSYQWKVNGSNVGTNSPTYTTSSLTNGQVVTCVMTSNSSCANPSSATSNGITITVTGTLTPAVSIAITSGSNPTCSGQSLTFTATPTNGGSSPSYQWKVNGSNVGTNSPTYTTSSLTNGQVVTCVMTSNLACASPSAATSNGITITVTGTLIPAVSIAITTGSNPSCTGQLVTFTATAVNGGSNPSYQWKVDGNNVGTNSPTYSTSSLTNGQMVSCIMTSNLSCASPSIANSNSITLTITSGVAPAIAISQSSCTGNSVGFTSGVTNGGSIPTYNWQIIAGAGTISGSGPSITVNNAANGTQVQCNLTSSLACANPATVSSNIITINCIVTSLPPVNGLEEFKIIPNPTDGLFVLSLRLNTLKEVSYRLLSITGQQVHQSGIYRISGAQTISVDGSKWPVGVYFVEITIGKERFTRKIELLRN